LAARALAPVLAGKESLSDTLPPAQAQVTTQDRSLLQALAFTACRYALYYRELLKPLLQRQPTPVVEALLLVGLAQLRDLRIPDHAALSETVNAARELGQDRVTGLINAVLRRYLREKDSLEAQAANSHGDALAHPDWLRQRLEQDWGTEAAQQIMAANNQEAALTLRVNVRQQDRTAYLHQLAEADINASVCAHSPVGIRVAQVSDVRNLPGFAAGAVSVQDEAAQLAVPLLDNPPGKQALDACAAPGGKTAHLLEHNAALTVTALDIAPERCARISENLQRLHLDGAYIVVADARDTAHWWQGSAFDRILLDAPCTATGGIRRHPDIKLLRRASDIAPTVALQAKLLAALWPLLAPGGRLLYATCSVLKAENEAQIHNFLSQHSDAQEIPLSGDWGCARPHGRQLFPGDTDGFFYALLQKQDIKNPA
jgi:16S rRNA (cytosine967-C5)-methyltransferase